MIDPIKILQRSWHILWNYRALWVFGLFLALATGTSYNSGSNNNMQWRDSRNGTQTPPPDLQELFRYITRELHTVLQQGIPDANITGPALTTFLWIVGVFVVLMFLVGIVMAVARYVSETAVIRMVDEYENTGTKLTIREGFQLGWSRTAWRLFLINLIVTLPIIILVVVLLIAGVVTLISAADGTGDFTTVSIVGLASLAFTSICTIIVLSIFLSLVRHFFWRVAVLENASVGESLRRGFGMVRENWKNVGLMWIVMVGLGIAWVVASLIAFILMIPVVIVTALIAIVTVAVPFLLLFGLFSTFLTGPLPWIAAGLFVLPPFSLIAFSPWLLLGSWKSVFTSTVWTLTYREIKALPAIAPQFEPVTVEG